MIAPLVERPVTAVFVLMLAQVVFWTLAPALSHSAPPLDVVEMYTWGREGVVATFKHPNLPGLILEATRLLSDQSGWPAYLVSQLFVAATFWVTFALGRDLMDAPRALTGTLLLTGVYFFSWPTPEFNHNVAQMPIWAALTLTLWRATTAGRWFYWLALGALAGLGLWAKYSFGVVLVVAAVWILWDGDARKRLLTPGPWIALAAFAAVAAPQAIWLIDNDFAPFGYAARRASSGEWHASLEFLATLAIDCAPMLIVLGIAGYFGAAHTQTAPPTTARARNFLLLLGLGPTVLMALGALVSGASLRASWGAPMLSLVGLLVVALMHDKFSADRLRRVALSAGVLVVLTSGLYFAHMRYGAAFTGKPLRGNWPQAEVSTQMSGTWRAETNGAPLEVVAGDIWTAGLVSMNGANPPSVLINGDYATSPWVTRQEVEQYGAMAVWSGDQPEALRDFIGARPVRVWTFYAPEAGPMGRGVDIHYAIIPPAATK